MSGDYDYLDSPEYKDHRERERLCSACVQAMATGGYQATTVARVSELSGCTPETFHRHYGSLAECFFDACSHTLQESRSATVTAWLTVHGWSRRLRRSCEALLRHVAEHPDTARAVLATSFAEGPGVSERLRDVIAVYERVLVMAFQLHPQGFPTSRLTPRALAGGMRHLLCRRMDEGREDELVSLSDDLHQWIECHRSQAAALLPIVSDGPSTQPAVKLEVSARSHEARVGRVVHSLMSENAAAAGFEQKRRLALSEQIVSVALQDAPPALCAKALLPDALVGAVNEQLAWAASADASDRLPALASHISFFLLAPYLGGERAAQSALASAASG